MNDEPEIAVKRLTDKNLVLYYFNIPKSERTLNRVYDDIVADGYGDDVVNPILLKNRILRLRNSGVKLEKLL